MSYLGDKKHYCGRYKGFDIYQVGQIIGNNWYGTFYAYKKVDVRSKKVYEASSLEELKKYINNNLEKGE